MYKMTNFGQARNCTISALFPAVVSLASLRIGGKSVRAQPKVNYDVIIILKYSISSVNIYTPTPNPVSIAQ